MSDFSRLKMSMPQLMGILNVTEDSFSDGGRFLEPEKAFAQARSMIAEGADIIDVGAESTRPGSIPVDQETELRRLIPVLKAIHTEFPHIPLSVDTQKSGVARLAVENGVTIINDISALRNDPELAMLIAENPQLKLILMHMSGTPRTMQTAPSYHDVLAEVRDFLVQRVDFCVSRGIRKEQIWLDPGIGFGKNLQHNLALMANLDCLTDLGLPVVLAASRKRFINEISPSAPEERLPGTLAVALAGALQHVHVLRVHDVAAHRQFLNVFRNLLMENG